MYNHLYSLLFLLTIQLASVAKAHSRTTLDQQCWHEEPLRTVNFQSSLDNSWEYVDSIQTLISDHVQAKEETEHAPWSHPPVCTEILQSINDKLCVYTSTTFGNGRGISIFTTPVLAEQFASLPAFHNPMALLSQDINTPTDTYHTTSIPGKGIGMLASQLLDFGARVTAHTPAFLAYLETELSTPDREAWWRVAIQQLPERLRKEFLGLSTVYGDERVRVQDIVKANTFQIEIGGVNHLAVWPETSRLNHACAPNAQYVIDTDLLTHIVHVTRPIAEGEEITISYTPPLEPTATRHHHLQQGFHFTCTCARCQSSEASDATLSRIRTLQSHLNDWSVTSLGSPAMAEELLQLHRGEGLEGFMDVAYGFAALAYNAVGKRKEAIAYAEKAEEAILMKDGIWSDNLRIWKSLIGEVDEHWSWRRRLR